MGIQLIIDNPGQGEWTYAGTQVSAADPGAGQWMTNAGNTRIDISVTTATGLSVDSILSQFESNAQIYVRVEGEDRLYTVSAVVNNTTWFELTVSVASSSTGFALNSGDLQALELRLPKGAGGGGVTDHGALTGLTPDDDHPQYFNQTRGDARYYTQAQVDSGLATKSDTTHTHLEADVTDLDKYTQAEVDSALTGKLDTSHAGGNEHIDWTVTGAEDIHADRFDNLPIATSVSQGIVELATDGESAANVVVQGNDSRLSDSRTPTSHASLHETGGADELTLSNTQITGLGTSSTVNTGTTNGTIPTHSADGEVTLNDGVDATAYAATGVTPAGNQNFVVGGTVAVDPHDMGIAGGTSNNASTKGGQTFVRGGRALGATSDGGDLSLYGGLGTNNDGDVVIGGYHDGTDNEQANEVRFIKGFSIVESADHPLAPATGKGQLWVRSSDGALIFTDEGGTDTDLTQPGSGSAVTVQDEGSTLTTDVTKFNFVGPGVTVTEPVADEVEVSVPTFSTSTTTQGVVPGSDGLTGTFLRGDGTWATPAGTGNPSLDTVIANADSTDNDVNVPSGNPVILRDALAANLTPLTVARTGVGTDPPLILSTQTAAGKLISGTVGSKAVDLTAEGLVFDSGTDSVTLGGGAAGGNDGADLIVTPQRKTTTGTAGNLYLEAGDGVSGASDGELNITATYGTATNIGRTGATITITDSAGSTGTAGQVLTSDGTDATWVDAVGATNISKTGTSADNQLLRWDGEDTLDAQNSVVTITDTGDIDTQGGTITCGQVNGRDIAADGGTLDTLDAGNTVDVSLAGTRDYLTIAGQTLTRNPIDVTHLGPGTAGTYIGFDALGAPSEKNIVLGDLQPFTLSQFNAPTALSDATVADIVQTTHSDFSTNYPSLGAGRLIVTTDAQQLWQDTATGWQQISAHADTGTVRSGLSLGASDAGYLFIETDASPNTFWRWDGTAWDQIGGAGGAGTVGTSGTPAAEDFARFTDATTIEGRSYAETRTDLGVKVINEGLAADRDTNFPAASHSGEYHFSTDTLAMERSNGTIYQEVGVLVDGVTLEVAANPTIEDLHIKDLGVDTDQLAAGAVTNDKIDAATIVASTKLTATGTKNVTTALRGSDVWGLTPSVSTGAGAPSSTPTAEGDVYVDTTNDNSYIAAGTASSADWKQATGTAGSSLDGLSDVTLTTPATDAILIKTAGDWVDGTINTASITDNAVTLAKLATKTDTNAGVIGYDGSGNPVEIEEGTSGHVLTSNGAASAPTFQAAPSAPTLTKSITVEDPAATEDICMFYTDIAITVTKITAVIVGSTSATFNISHGTSRAAVTNDVMQTDDVADSTTTGNITTDFTGGDNTIPANSFVALTVSARNGTPTELHVTVEYTED